MVGVGRNGRMERSKRYAAGQNVLVLLLQLCEVVVQLNLPGELGFGMLCTCIHV